MRNKLFGAAALLLTALCALPAKATILWAGAEDVSFNRDAGCAAATECFVTTTVGDFRADWTRSALAVKNGVGGCAVSIVCFFYSPTWTATSDIWIHFQLRNSSASSGTTSGAQPMVLYASDGNPALYLRATGTNGQVKVSKRSVAGAYTDLATCTAGELPITTLSQYDMHVVYAVSGSVNIFRNGSSICTYTGDVTTDSRTLLNKIGIGPALNNLFLYWSEVIVATTTTVNMNLMTLAPNANGATTSWTGSNICSSIWNATTYADATYASTSTNNAIHLCEVTDTLPGGVYSVPAVGIAARALVGATGPQHIELATRLGSTNYFSSDCAPTTSFTSACLQMQTTNPATAAAWATSDIPGIQIGLKATP